MDAAVDTKTHTGWQHELYDLLRRHGVSQFAYVPDAGHSILIDRSLADPEVHSIALTTEEEGVALIAGADLGGARAVLLMQSSGVGNCINMERPEDVVASVDAALTMAFKSGKAVAVLLTQRLIGAKPF